MPCARPVHHRTLLANAFSSRQWALSLSTFPSFPRAMTCKEFWMVAAGQTSAHDEPSQVDHRRAYDDRIMGGAGVMLIVGYSLLPVLPIHAILQPYY